MNNQKAYSKQVIEIADYILANPLAKRRDIMARFGKKWQTPERTLDRIWKEAKECSKSTTQKEQKAKEDVFVEEAKKTAKSNILSRNEALQILSKIARDKTKKENDRINCIDKLAKIEGWEKPAKVAQTDSEGNDIENIIEFTLNI